MRRIEEFINLEEDYDYNVMVGSDSQAYGRKVNLVTVVICHRVGRGAIFFYNKNVIIQKMSMQERLLKEAQASVEIVDKIEHSPIALLADNIEVHVDVGAQGESQKVMKDCISFVRSMGHICVAKPEAVCASHVADRFVR